MTYDELKNSAINKYGSQDDIPDSVYNSLVKYKSQGQDALSDDEYHILASLKSNQTKAPSNVGGTGYPDYKSGEYEDLYQNASNVGYSGLDSAQQKLFNEAFPYSKAAASGMKLKEAQDMTDKDAAYAPDSVKDDVSNFVNDAGKVIRHVTAIPPAVIGAGLGTIQGIGNSLFPNSISDNGPIEGFKSAYKQGVNDEGLAGAFADPLNYVFPLASKIVKPLSLAEAGIGKGLERLPTDAIKDLGTGLVNLSKTAPTPFTQGVNDAITGGTLGAVDQLIDNYGNKKDLSNGVLGSALGNAAGQGLVGSLNKAVLGNRLNAAQEALDKFPGDRWLKTQANKKAKTAEEGMYHLTDAEKTEILKNVSQLSKERGGKPGIDDWIRYQEQLKNKSTEGYGKTEAAAETQNLLLPSTEISIPELKQDLIQNLKNKNTGTYSNNDIEKFINKSFEGFEDVYGKDEHIPIHKLSLLKSKFNEDIFDPKFTTSPGTELRRNLARKSSNRLQDYFDRPAYLNTATKPAPSQVNQQALDAFRKLSPQEQTQSLREAVKQINPKISPEVSYNQLLDAYDPQAKNNWKLAANLATRFQHQREATGSKRIGTGLGALFEGGTHLYKPTGDIYEDAIRNYEMGKSKRLKWIPAVINYSVGGATNLIHNKTKDDKKKK